MAFGDNENVVVLEIEDSRVREGVKSANTALDSFEKKAATASKAASQKFDGVGETIVRTMDRSRGSIERLVASAEKRAATAGTTKLQQLMTERDLSVGRVAGDPQAVERMNAAYSKLIAQEKELERQAGMKRLAEDAKKAEAEVKRTGAALGETANRLLSFGAMLTGAITVPLTLGAAAAFKMSEQFNRARTAFTGMLGSARAAVGFLGELEQFALSTPFEFANLIPAAQRMKAFGFNAREVIPILRAVGDAAAGLGASTETMDRIALALGQIRQKGKVSAEEMRQLAEAGIPAWEILAAKIGKSIPEAMKLAESGALSASKTLPAILEGMVAKFAGQMQAQNRLLSGQFSNLKDQFGFTLRAVGDALTPVASKLVQFGLTAVTSLKGALNAFMALPEPIRNTTVVMLGLLASIGPVTLAIGGLTKAMAMLFGLQAIGGLRMLPQIFRDITLAATGGTLALTALETKLLFLGKAALVAATAFAAWSFGRWIREATGLGDAIDKLYAKIGILSERMDPREQQRINEQFAAVELRQASQIYETLKKRGILIERNGMATEDWLNQLKATLNQMNVFDDMAKRGADSSIEAAKKRADAEKHVQGLLRQAHIEEFSGLSKIIAKRAELLQQYGLSAKAIAGINELTRIQFANEQKRLQADFGKATADAVKNIEEEQQKKREFDTRRFKEAQDFERETLDIALQSANQRFEIEQDYLDREKDSRLRAIESEQAQINDRNRNAVGLKVALEQQRLAVEEDYIARRAALQAEDLRRRYDQEIEFLEAIRAAGSITDEQFQARRTVLTDRLTKSAQTLEERGILQIEAAREESYQRSAQVYVDAHQRAFDETKASFESLLDAMFSRSKSWGDAMKAILRASVLQPLKDFAGTLFASAVTGSPARASGGGGGILGGLLGGVLGGGGIGIPGAPGGTGGFAGPVRGIGPSAGMASIPLTLGGLGGGFGVPMTGGAQTAGILGSLKAQGTALTGMLGNLGNIGHRGGWSGSGLSGTRGVGGTAGGAMLLGGGILAADGLRRGGILGLAETTAGGALIGAKFGGPIGAAIGAGVGALAGFVRLFVKGAQEKLRAKIKAVYSIDVADKGLLKSLMDTIKSQFGGNIDLGIRSPQIRDLLELYAMSTGQGDKFPIANKVRPVSFSQTSGGLSMMPSYENGRQLPFAGTLDRAQATGATIGGPITIRLDGQATTSLLRGEAVNVIVDSPRQVSMAATSGQRASAGRRESQALAFGQAGLVTG